MVDYPAEVVSSLVSVGEDCISELVVRDERERVSPLRVTSPSSSRSGQFSNGWGHLPQGPASGRGINFAERF